MLAAAWFQAFFAVDEDGDWSYVVDLDQHVLPEAAGFYFKSGSAQELDECLDQGLCFLRGSCISEAGAAALARISQEGELAHYQYLSADVQCGEVEFICFVGEDAEVGDFVCQVLGVWL